MDRLDGNKVVVEYLSAASPFADFGLYLYPDGDSRTAALLALFETPKSTHVSSRK